MTATSVRPSVTKELVLTTTLDQIEQYGLDVLSMRRIGDPLGIQAASLYWYFASKEDLLDGVADYLLGLAADYLDERGCYAGTGTTEERLACIVASYRQFVRSHPGSERILTHRFAAGENLARLIEPIITIFAAVGLDVRDASRAVLTLLTFVHGEVAADKARLSSPAVVDAIPSPANVLAGLAGMAESFPMVAEAAGPIADRFIPAADESRFTAIADALIAALIPAR